MIIPLIALVALWILAIGVAIGPAMDLRAAVQNANQVGRPGDAMVAALQTERSLSVQYLAAGRRDAGALIRQRAVADRAVADFRRLSGGYNGRTEGSDLIKQRIKDTANRLGALSEIRSQVDSGTIDRSTALQDYTDIVSTTFGALFAAARHTDPGVEREFRGLVSISQSRELLSQEDALVTGAIVAGRMTVPDLQQYASILGAVRFTQPNADSELPLAIQQQYSALLSGNAFTDLHGIEDQLLTRTRPDFALPISLTTWRNTFTPASDEIRTFLTGNFLRATADAKTAGTNALLRPILIRGLSLIAVIICLFISIRTGRSVMRRLTALEHSATELADTRLPAVVTQLRKGEDVNVETAAPPIALGDDEIGRVGQAFNKVQRTAIESAVDQATLRQGMNEVFLNIARRSQSLLHRQLTLLDQMERAAVKTDDLRNLFRADHLATRMRRHAEDLVILAGAAPSRGWRNPVPLLDVIRGAISEVEDYERVAVLPVIEGSIPGRAVADLIHLLAELLENATSYSPPHTPVNVGAQLVPHGVAVEIEDRGLGMTVESLDWANERLANPPDFDPANSARLGLFVVSQLAARHGVRVTLRQSPYGGVTAIALLPTDLVLLPESIGFPRGTMETFSGDFQWLTPSEAAPQSPTVTAQPAPARPNAPSAGPPLARRRPAAPPPPVLSGTPVLPGTPPDRPGPDEATEPTSGSGRTTGTPAARLPRRVRQANLAPQLRADQRLDSAPGPEAVPERPPEQARSMMSAYQMGSHRARLLAGLQNGDPAADEPPASGEREEH